MLPNQLLESNVGKQRLFIFSLPKQLIIIGYCFTCDSKFGIKAIRVLKNVKLSFKLPFVHLYTKMVCFFVVTSEFCLPFQLLIVATFCSSKWTCQAHTWRMRVKLWNDTIM
jgi:hypothetical protein